jgi:hydrogenase nickel incorporation protein HypA/HybF
MVHEWALAEAIVEYLVDVFKDRRPSSIIIRLGELRSVNEDTLSFSLKTLLSMRGFGEPGILIERVPINLVCRSCGLTWSIRLSELPEEVREFVHLVPEVLHSYVKCPSCGSRDFKISSGKEIYIEGVVVGE